MNEFPKLSVNNEERFTFRVLQGEAKLLQREKNHLIQKGFERSLSVWEQSRLEEIFNELNSILLELSKYKKQDLKAA